MAFFSILKSAQIRRFVRDERGATAVEYGLLTALISVTIVAAVTNTGTNLKNTYTTLTGALSNMAK